MHGQRAHAAAPAARYTRAALTRAARRVASFDPSLSSPQRVCYISDFAALHTLLDPILLQRLPGTSPPSPPRHPADSSPKPPRNFGCSKRSPSTFFAPPQTWKLRAAAACCRACCSC